MKYRTSRGQKPQERVGPMGIGGRWACPLAWRRCVQKDGHGRIDVHVPLNRLIPCASRWRCIGTWVGPRSLRPPDAGKFPKRATIVRERPGRKRDNSAGVPNSSTNLAKQKGLFYGKWNPPAPCRFQRTHAVHWNSPSFDKAVPRFQRYGERCNTRNEKSHTFVIFNVL